MPDSSSSFFPVYFRSLSPCSIRVFSDSEPIRSGSDRCAPKHYPLSYLSYASVPIVSEEVDSFMSALSTQVASY